MTYKEKRQELLEHLRGAGWKVSTQNSRTFQPLKVPYALSPDGSKRLSFRTQAVYLGEHSLVSDMKSVSGAELVEIAMRRDER